MLTLITDFDILWSYLLKTWVAVQVSDRFQLDEFKAQLGDSEMQTDSS